MSYYCECCKYRTPYKINFEKHLNTNKHEKKKQYSEENRFICKYCSKKYRHKQSLSKHMSLCEHAPKNDTEKINELEEKIKICEDNNKLLNDKLSQQIELFKEMQDFMNKTFNKIFKIQFEK